MSSDSRIRAPMDVIAIFHCSFHPTKGNIIDWSTKVSQAPSLDGVEFSTLPSGLHLIDDDVVHITQDVHHGISIFRRRPTDEIGMRGYRLESLGILVAQSARPRPWRHLSSLRELAYRIDQALDNTNSRYSEREGNWSPLKEWFSEHMFRRANEEGELVSWEKELTADAIDHPLLHLPRLLRTFGPSSLTLYKHALVHRRILIYTVPPVESACILTRITSDICGREDQRIILGMVSIHDLDRIKKATQKGHGWIACTTDAIVLEKPHLYDLLIDMTVPRPSRPALFMSRPISGHSRGSSHRLTPVRFTFSDVRLWSELDRILRVDSEELGESVESKFPWVDGWRFYEDMCVACAGAWMGGWKANGSSWRIGKSGTLFVSDNRILHLDDAGDGGNDGENQRSGRGIKGPGMASTSSYEGLSRQACTALALLNVFHAHSEFLSERLSELLEYAPVNQDNPGVICLTPRDILTLELGLFSELDAKFLQWLAEINEKAAGKKVIVKRGWRDLLSVLVGFG